MTLGGVRFGNCASGTFLDIYDDDVGSKVL